MDQQVGVDHHVEGGLECLDQLVGQLAYEADRVAQEHRLATGQLEPSRGGIQGGEESVLHQDLGVRQVVQQRRLSCVRVAHDGHRQVAGLLAGLGLGGAVLADPTEVGLEAGDPTHEPSSVHLQLGLAGAPGTDAAGLLAERAAGPPQPGQPVPELGQLHLRLSLGAAGVLGEDVEDHCRTIQRGAVQDLLEVALLGRREVVVEDHGVGVERLGHRPDLVDLSPADIGRPVRGIAMLDDPGHRIRPGRLDQTCQLVHRGVGCFRVGAAQGDTSEDNALPERPVDEAGRLAGKLAERAPVRLLLRLLVRHLLEVGGITHRQEVRRGRNRWSPCGPRRR